MFAHLKKKNKSDQNDIGKKTKKTKKKNKKKTLRSFFVLLLFEIILSFSEPGGH